LLGRIRGCECCCETASARRKYDRVSSASPALSLIGCIRILWPVSTAIATNPAKLGNVRHLQIRYHLVRCYVSLGDVELKFCVTEEMVADLFTKLVAGAQDERLTVRLYCLIPGSESFVLTNDFKNGPSSAMTRE
jgi:hypothetical protein